MNPVAFLIMLLFTLIGIKYLRDMVRYAKGFEINGKCRYGKKYAAYLLKAEKGSIARRNKRSSTYRYVEGISD